MAKRSRLIAGLVIAFVYYFNPLYVRSTLTQTIGTLFGAITLSPNPEPESLKAAVNNVTEDFYQLSNLLQDFFERLPDNSTEILFREFLSTKANRSHKELERYLDMVLGFYRFAWPFVIVYIILRITSGTGKEEVKEMAKVAERGKKSSRKKYETYADERFQSRRQISVNAVVSITIEIPQSRAN